MNPLVKNIALRMCESLPASIFEIVLETLMEIWNDFVRLYNLPFKSFDIEGLKNVSTETDDVTKEIYKDDEVCSTCRQFESYGDFDRICLPQTHEQLFFDYFKDRMRSSRDTIDKKHDYIKQVIKENSTSGGIGREEMETKTSVIDMYHHDYIKQDIKENTSRGIRREEMKTKTSVIDHDHIKQDRKENTSGGIRKKEIKTKTPVIDTHHDHVKRDKKENTSGGIRRDEMINKTSVIDMYHDHIKQDIKENTSGGIRSDEMKTKTPVIDMYHDHIKQDIKKNTSEGIRREEMKTKTHVTDKKNDYKLPQKKGQIDSKPAQQTDKLFSENESGDIIVHETSRRNLEKSTINNADVDQSSLERPKTDDLTTVKSSTRRKKRCSIFNPQSLNLTLFGICSQCEEMTLEEMALEISKQRYNETVVSNKPTETPKETRQKEDKLMKMDAVQSKQSSSAEKLQKFGRKSVRIVEDYSIYSYDPEESILETFHSISMEENCKSRMDSKRLKVIKAESSSKLVSSGLKANSEAEDIRLHVDRKIGEKKYHKKDVKESTKRKIDMPLEGHGLVNRNSADDTEVKKMMGYVVRKTEEKGEHRRGAEESSKLKIDIRAEGHKLVKRNTTDDTDVKELTGYVNHGFVDDGEILLKSESVDLNCLSGEDECLLHESKSLTDAFFRSGSGKYMGMKKHMGYSTKRWIRDNLLPYNKISFKKMKSAVKQ